MRWIVALFALLASPVAATPSLDPTTHPYIALVSTDKATYAPGATGTIKLLLRNPSGSSFTGTAEVAIYRNTAVVGFNSQAITIPGSGTLAATASFTAPSSDNRGYLVAITIKNGSSTIVDGAPGAIDVQAAALPTKFPRQCWVTGGGLALDTAVLTDSLIAWHCNTVQAYDVYYKPELAPPSTLATWPTLDNTTVARMAVQGLITAAHARRMPVLFFQATGEAYDTFLAQKTGPKLAWGSFTRGCSNTLPCTASDMDRTPTYPDNWTQYGWQADHIVLFDTCNASWRQHLVGKSIKPMIDQFGFDGWQADTLGAPGGTRYNYSGAAIDPGACISTETTDAQAQLGRPVILNNVSGWQDRQTALTGNQPYLYRETWNFDTLTYAGLDALVNDGNIGLRRFSSRALVQPAYIQRDLSDGCSTGAIVSGCAVNPVSAKLATAMFAVAGSTLMNHMDDRCMMTGVYVPGYHLTCAPATQDALLAYKAFEVAYQPMLRDGVAQSVEACTITGGATGGTSGIAGQVFVLGKTKAGFQICHLLNLRGLSTNEWTDLNGTMPVPTAASSIGMKLYYAGSPVVSGTNVLWWVSPDVANGAAQTLSYTTGSDGSGQYVSFTVPSLAYWDMIVLETNGWADADLHTNPRDLIRGVHYNDAANGVSPISTVATNGCCGRWSVYRGLAFTGTSPTTVTMLYGTVGTGLVQFRLDSLTGPIVATCALPPTGGFGAAVSKSCPVTNATGTRDLFVIFNGQPVALYNFVFG